MTAVTTPVSTAPVRAGRVARRSLVWAAVVLATGLAITLLGRVISRPVMLHETLLRRLPSPPATWAVTDLPVATSEEMKKAVKELLNYDGAVFREYRHAGKSLTLYAAYWQPRRFHPRLVAMHTPDVCWVSNGWQMEQPDYAWKLDRFGLDFWPAQYRWFRAENSSQHVLYWHVVNGRLSGYALGPQSRNDDFLANFWPDLRMGAGEQFFIRFASAVPWSEWEREPFFRELLRHFAPVLSVAPSA